MLFFFLLHGCVFLEIQSDKARNGGCQTEDLAQNSTDGEIEDVVGQPEGGIDKVGNTDDLCTFACKAKGHKGHTDDRKKFKDQIPC